MKITVLSTACPLRGGIAHFVALLVAALKEKHDVSVLTFKRQYPAFLFPGKTQEETAGEGHGTPAPQVMDSINPFNWIRVGLRLRRKRPDLIIFKYWLPFFGPCFGTIARIARSNGHTKVLFICDNVLPHEKRPGDVLFTRYAFRAVDHFIVQSASVEKDLLMIKPGASYRFAAHPIYNIFGTRMPAADARRTLGITAQHVLLFFGYIRKYKGLHVLLDAIHRLPSSFPLHTLVVGEFYDDERAYREHVERLGLGDRVTIVSDYVPNDKVREYFSAADAVVLPYLSATQSGIAQIAYNFDVPVIATDVGGLAEVVLHDVTGLIVAPDDPDALASTIRRYFDDGLAERYRPQVRMEKVKYTWENLVDSIEQLMGLQ
jgi:glycosyltransferase involved in cell wall biosynthesis